MYPFVTSCNCCCYKIFLYLWIIFVILPSCYVDPKGPLCRETVENVNNSTTMVLLYLSNISLEKDSSVYIISRKVQRLAKKSFEKSWLFYFGSNRTRLFFLKCTDILIETVHQKLLDKQYWKIMSVLNQCCQLLIFFHEQVFSWIVFEHLCIYCF